MIAELMTQLRYPCSAGDAAVRLGYWLGDAVNDVPVAGQNGTVIGCLSLASPAPHSPSMMSRPGTSGSAAWGCRLWRDAGGVAAGVTIAAGLAAGTAATAAIPLAPHRMSRPAQDTKIAPVQLTSDK